MKRFRVEHKDYDKPPNTVTLWKPPYENENILYKTGYKEKDCIISEVYSGYDGQLGDHSIIDFTGEEE